MTRVKTLSIMLISGLAITLANVIAVDAQALADRSTINNGEPTIIGSMGGSVNFRTGQLKDLSLIVNFGEISPINHNRIVKVIVPIIIQASSPYQLSASVSLAGDTQVIKLSDIGFGLQNLHPIGSKSALKSARPAIYTHFENDPSIIDKTTGRITYRSSLADLNFSQVILANSAPNQSPSSIRNNIGWEMDAIFVIAPQFYPPGQFILTITFSTSTVSPINRHP